MLRIPSQTTLPLVGLLLCLGVGSTIAQLPPSRFLEAKRSSFRPQVGARNPFLPIKGSGGIVAPAEMGDTVAGYSLPPGAFRLSGVLLDETAPLAVINGRSYTLGEQVSYSPRAGVDLQFTVLEIRDREVDLKCQELRVTLHMGGKGRAIAE